MATSLNLMAIEEFGFFRVETIAQAIVSKLTGVDPSGGTPGMEYFRQVFASDTMYLLEPTNLVDANRGATNTVPTWRLAITLDTEKQLLHINVATPVQLLDDGTISIQDSWGSEPKNPGEIKNFIDRERIKTELQSRVYPMSYCISISDHGLFLGIWDQAFDEYQNTDKLSPAYRSSPALKWILIQRMVTSDTGEVILDGCSPVFCVFATVETSSQQPTEDWQLIPGVGVPGAPTINYGLTGILMRNMIGSVYQRFIVCERDITRPSLTHPADIATDDVSPILNTYNMVATSENNSYVIHIPNGLNTSRYAYPHELDMIAYTSADVIGQGTEVDLNLYMTTLRYKALPSNRLDNTGMRILYRINTTV